MSRSLIARAVVVVLLLGPVLPAAIPAALAQEETEALERDLVRYPARFFERFRPVTALDMVNQVPGFRLEEDTGDVRGFASSGGNVLIDDRRPSTKRDSLTDILSRIPAATVLRIELIRGQVRNIDLRGQSEVVNLVLREGIPAIVQWRLAGRKTFGFGPVSPDGSISVADTLKGVDVSAGLNARQAAIGRQGIETILAAAGEPVESRFEERNNRNKFYSASLNASAWAGETFWQVNTNLRYEDRRSVTDSERTDDSTGARTDVFFEDIEDTPSFETGLDLERQLSADWRAKGILLSGGANADFTSAQIETEADGARTLERVATGELDSREIIARLEFDFTRFANHQLQFNLERAVNVLDSNLTQTDDTGDGPVVIDIPGADSRVEEVRWDFLAEDTWLLGRYELNFGIGAEASTIRQTGDAVLERDFFFLKPQFVLTYSAANADLTRVRLAREVAQLDLEDFVSATEFLDDDIALGNPNIEPDSTWKLELTQEKRLGTSGVVKLTAFHHWISDVLDLLPLSESFEAPGNIGDGRRWGLLFESTLPLDRIGLANAKLDAKIRWQDSSVADPVTGEDRVLSVGNISGGPVVFDIENEYAVILDFRQDFRAARAAWGFSLWERGRQLQFKVNELEVYDEGAEFRVFVETTRWRGIRVRLDAENLLDFADERRRLIYAGLRGTTPVETRQFRDRSRGRRLELSFSGSF
ncbi:MAG: hypothetical protein R3176_11195 [Woeseiaceae bacterium]|nr:hypothetical protein [Woeseiaceae bacterium]